MMFPSSAYQSLLKRDETHGEIANKPRPKYNFTSRTELNNKLTASVH
jgi:hypothetical protein